MCGIAGILSGHKKSAIYKMTDALAHRGPDEQGHYQDEYIALGQRRLSIIDLDGGKQPISNEDGRLQIVCNGEIYNSPELRKRLVSSGHFFKTATDVEVILHLYEEKGVQCLKEIRGMFAFAIWDSKRQTLFLARDHLGQKPLFYYKGDNEFLFSSEVKGILASGLVQPEIDLDGLWHYVSLRFIPDEYTLFQNIKKLPAGTYLFLQDGNLYSEKYWELDFTKKIQNTEQDIEEELHSLLMETVNLHLLSDVRVGAFLSGGIDSGLISAMMATIQKDPVPSFSIGVKEQSFNELPFARMVSEKYKMEAHEKKVNASIVDLVPSMVYHMDEPSDPYGVGVYLVSQVASEYVKVVLSGDGGDENFAGYDRFAGNRILYVYALLPRWLREKVMKRIIDRLPETFSYKSLTQKAAWANEMSLYSGGARYAQSLGFLRFTRQAKEQLFTPSVRKDIDDYDSFEKVLRFFDAENANDLVDKMLYTDLMTRMPDHLLVIADRMTMAHGLESRPPMLDYKIVEYAASLPAQYKLKGTRLKYILRKVASRYLPPELIYRKKQGFAFPLGIWFKKDLKNLLQNLFADSRFVQLGIMDEKYIHRILDEHLQGRADHSYRLWILMNLEIWYRMYFENETVESMKDQIYRFNA